MEEHRPRSKTPPAATAKSDEFDRFENLARKLISVPRDQIRKQEDADKAKRPKKKKG